MTKRKQGETVKKIGEGRWLVWFKPSGGCYQLHFAADGRPELLTGVNGRPAGESAVARFMDRALRAVGKQALTLR